MRTIRSTTSWCRSRRRDETRKPHGRERSMKCLLFLAFGLLLAAACGVVAIRLSDPQRRVNPENWEKVQKCANRQEVIEIFGEPHYGPGELPNSFSGTLASMMMEAEAEVWRAGEWTFYVCFTPDGKINGTMSSQSSYRETLLD